MKTDSFQYNPRSNEFQYNCAVDFGEKPGEPITLTMENNRNEYIARFDSQTFKPLGKEIRVQGSTTIWEMQEVALGQYPGFINAPCFRHTITESSVRPQEVGSRADYVKSGYADTMSTLYKALDLAIDRLPNCAQKEMLRGNFNRAMAQMGYKPIEKSAAISV